MSYFLENQHVVWRDEVTLYNDGTVKRHEDRAGLPYMVGVDPGKVTGLVVHKNRDGFPYRIDVDHPRVKRDALGFYWSNDPGSREIELCQTNKSISDIIDEYVAHPGNINKHLRKPKETQRMPAKADLQAAMRELARQLAEAERFPDDTFEDGTIWSWEKELPVLNTATREYEQKPYRWAAVKGSGKWYISTAKKAVQIVDYDTLCALTDGQPVYLMVQGEKVVRGRNEKDEPEKLADVVGTETAKKIEIVMDSPPEKKKDSWVTRERPTRDAS